MITRRRFATTCRAAARRTARVAALWALGAACAGCARGTDAPPVVRVPLPTAAGVEPSPRFAADTAHGARLYAAHCARCHGRDGAGDGPLAVGLSPPPPNWTEATSLADRRPDAMYNAVRRGVLGTSMKRFDPVLDAPSTWDVVFYVWQLPVDDAERAAGDTLYSARCAACHAPNGRPEGIAPGPALVRPEWVVKTRAQLVQDLAAAHPWVAAAPGAASDAAVIAERLWRFLTVTPGVVDR